MLFLVLGKGKTGSLVAEVARGRGHSVRVLDLIENRGAAALTAPTLAGVDVVIDFTNAASAIENMRAVLALGGRIVVGTTGWYDRLDEMKTLAHKRGGALLYGANFSLSVQKLFRLTELLAHLHGYKFEISETHHTSKLDAPSGTAITLRQIIETAQPGIQVGIASHRIGDAAGEHVVTATCEQDTLSIRHDSHSRRGFALGAVRAAEWLAGKSGTFDFRDVFEQL
jgi:4-hydroxy-tetrahydrodipicolinate reductase